MTTSLTSNLPKKSTAFLLGALLSLASASAQTNYYWDADGDGSGSLGGTGTWNTPTPALWRVGSNVGALGAWPNTDPSSAVAVFEGTAGTVTVASGATINANGLNFSQPSSTPFWKLESGDSVSNVVLSGSNNSIVVAGKGGAQFSAAFNTKLKLSNGTTAVSGDSDITTGTRLGIGVNPDTANAIGNLTVEAGGTANFFSAGASMKLFAVGQQYGAFAGGVSSVQGTADFRGGKVSLYSHLLQIGLVVQTNGLTTNTGNVVGTMYQGSDVTSALVNDELVTIGNITLTGASEYTGSATGELTLGGNNTFSSANATEPVVYVGRFVQTTGQANGTHLANASGTLNISGGTTTLTSTGGSNSALVLAKRDTWLHANSTASGTLNLTGGTLSINGGEILGGGGTSIVNLNGGTLNMNGRSLGQSGGLITTLNFQSGALQNVFRINDTAGLNKTSAGTLTLSGFNRYTGDTIISEGTVSAGSIVVASGYSDLGNSTTAVGLGAASTKGTLSYTGNTATYTRGFTIGNGGGQLDVTTSGQTLTVGTGAITGTAGLLTVGGAGNTTITSAITTGTGGLTKTGAGTLTLTNSGNTYIGSTIVSQGTLILSGSGAVASNVIQVQQGAFLTAASGLQLQNGQTLENKGTFTGALTALNGSTYAPGNSPGIATQAGDLTFNTGSTFEWELIANTDAGAGTNFDQTVFTSGGLTIQTGVTANLVFNAGSTVDWANAFWGSDQQWLVFSGASSLSNVAGIFTSITVGVDAFSQSLASARSGATFSFTNVGDDVYLTYSIPEPSTTLLLTGGLMAALFLRRRARI